ncbi:MAG TPA: alpha/beta hydrolase [Polyangiaceae bacterium]|nr:alpha/beta hydrolase [Polyangiaceae bacterium]
MRRERLTMTFVLSYSDIGDAAAPHTAFVLHGALGAGHNFRSFIRKLHAKKPEFRFVLVDLRHHGQSQGAPPPHTLAACAEDLAVLGRHLKVTPEVIIGHSFGGKVALKYASRAPEGLRQIWALDSDPSARAIDPDHEVWRVLEAVRGVALPAPTRAAVVDELQRRGLSSGIANWLSTNLKHAPDGFRWNLDLDAVVELMTNYFQEDLWPFLEQPPPHQEIFLVVAERSDRFGDATRRRAAQLSAANVRVLPLADSGHWVHIDNPTGLLAMLEAHLTASASLR